jgi:hypothetical protein
MKMKKNEKIPVWYRDMKISGMKKEHGPTNTYQPIKVNDQKNIIFGSILTQFRLGHRPQKSFF